MSAGSSAHRGPSASASDRHPITFGKPSPVLPVTNLRRIDLTTREGYDKQSWLEEAERHVRSAKLLRSIRRRRRSRFKTVPESRRLQYVRTMDAAVHSSTLLIAYAFELLLKAGLTAFTWAAHDSSLQGTSGPASATSS